MSIALAIIVSLLFGFAWGWGAAHKTVATECERLGSFYVGPKTFHCTKIEDSSFDTNDIPPRPEE
jgi:hypothetical protein